MGRGSAVMKMSRFSSFHMPAEWSRHARTILAWPSRISKTYPTAKNLNAATDDVSSVAEAVAPFEPVTLTVDNDGLADARQMFESNRMGGKHQIRLRLIAASGLDLWMRDIAPIFVIGQGRANPGEETPEARPLLHGVDFNFNGWGN